MIFLTGARHDAVETERTTMSVLYRIQMRRPRGPGQTLLWVGAVSFCATGTLLLGRDPIEHANLSNLSTDSVYRIHVGRGISTGVLVSIAIAWLMMRNQERYEKRMRRIRLD